MSGEVLNESLGSIILINIGPVIISHNEVPYFSELPDPFPET